MKKWFNLSREIVRILHSYSIKKKIRLSYIIIIGILLVPAITSVMSSVYQSLLYDQIITNVNKTNRLNQIVKTAVSNEIWDIFAGNRKFSEGKQYEIIDDINHRLSEIMETTEATENRQILEVAGRAVVTLTRYVDRMGLQMEEGSPVEDNQVILDEIRGVSTLVSDLLQDFIVLEIEAAAVTNESIKQRMMRLAIVHSGVVLLVALFAFLAQHSVSISIHRPIKQLEIMSQKIAQGDLDVRAELPHVEELDPLTEHLNEMAFRIRELLEANIREQKNLQKSEMKALQAQITPHFLYNTLDTIVWLAEAHRHEQVIHVTRAFSRFFRTSLSRGKDWIPVQEEINHVESYLAIQKVRYRDILEYSIDYDPSMAKNAIVKLLLQPLVENALYHGIKNKRGGGRLTVQGRYDGDRMLFVVEDNGKGIEPERLEHVLLQLETSEDSDSISDVYGLYNVNKRLELFYSDQARLEIESKYKEGTRVSFSVPVVKQYV